MHEYSIAQSLLDLCEQNANDYNAKTVMSVEVKIGVLSGVEPYLLQTAFDACKIGTICENAQMKTIISGLEIHCNDCSKTSPIEKPILLCPHCQSTNVKITNGEELYLMHLEMQ